MNRFVKVIGNKISTAGNKRFGGNRPGLLRRLSFDVQTVKSGKQRK